jgi:hypothetical protein
MPGFRGQCRSDSERTHGRRPRGQGSIRARTTLLPRSNRLRQTGRRNRKLLISENDSVSATDRGRSRKVLQDSRVFPESGAFAGLCTECSRSRKSAVFTIVTNDAPPEATLSEVGPLRIHSPRSAPAFQDSACCRTFSKPKVIISTTISVTRAGGPPFREILNFRYPHYQGATTGGQ